MPLVPVPAPAECHAPHPNRRPRRCPLHDPPAHRRRQAHRPDGAWAGAPPRLRAVGGGAQVPIDRRRSARVEQPPRSAGRFDPLLQQGGEGRLVGGLVSADRPVLPRRRLGLVAAGVVGPGAPCQDCGDDSWEHLVRARLPGPRFPLGAVGAVAVGAFFPSRLPSGRPGPAGVAVSRAVSRRSLRAVEGAISGGRQRR